jgi:hypothetical protein
MGNIEGNVVISDNKREQMVGGLQVKEDEYKIPA